MVDISQAFVWGEGGKATTPDELAQRRKLAQALMERGNDYSPVQSWTQGAARVANSIFGAMMARDANEAEKAAREKANADTAALFGGVTGGGAAPAAQTPSFVATGGKMAQAPSDLAPLFDEASKATGIPAPVLMAKVRQESNFNPNAIGGAGEVGLTQVLPSTARDPGFGMQGVDPASLKDPRANIMFGANYLAARGKAAGVQDWNNPQQVAKALTAYNGGGDPNYASNVMRFLPADFGKGAEPAASAPQQQGMPASAHQAPGAGQGKVAQAMLGRAMSVLNDPYASEGGKAAARLVVQQALTPQAYTYQTLPDGTILRMDPRGSAPVPIYQAPTKPTYGVTGKDQFGNEQYGWIDASKQTVTPAQPAGAAAGGPAPGPNGRPMVAGPTGPVEVPEGADPKAFRTKMTDAAAEKAVGPKADQIESLRKETQQLPSYKNYAQAIPAYNSVVDAARRDTKAADLNLVYGLAKIMDPGSVVREGELQMANDTQGVAERLIGMVKSINGGARLGPKARAALLAEAQSRMGSFKQAHDEDYNHYGEISDAMGIKRDLVLPRLPKMSTIDPKDIAGDPANDGEAPVKAGPVTDGRAPKTPPAPKGVDPALWQHMTDEERALWK